MNKLNILAIILVSIIIFSCSTIKKGSTTDEKLISQNDENNISEDNQNKFKIIFIEALKQKMLGNPKQAVTLFSSCLEIDPNSAASMYELANIHVSNNDFTSASLLLEKAISINSENKWYKLLLARIYQQTRKYNEAAEIYRNLSTQEPDNIDYLYFNAVMLSGAEKFDDAIDAYRKMEKKVGINEQISISLQQLLVSAGKIDEAYAEIQKLIDHNPEESKYYGLLADMYLSQGDKENALKYYQKILEMDPDNGFVHFSLSSYFQEAGDFKKGFDHTKKGFLSNEVDLETKLQLYLMLTADQGKSKLTQDNNEELIKILLEVHPDDSRVFMVYAEYLIRMDKLKEAREQLKNVLVHDNGDYMIWERVLFIDNDLQDWDGLYNDSKNAISLFPNQPQVYFLNGVACVQLEKFEETLNICNEGLDFVIDNPQLEGQFILLQGEAQYKLGFTDEAFKYFDKAIELDPNNHIALNNYAYYLSILEVNLDKAERMSGKVIELFPDNSTYLDTHAWVLFKKKNFQLAKFYMESAIKSGGEENATLLEHYGDILIMLKKTDEAKEYWQKAKKLGSDSAVLDRKISDLKYYENEEK